MFINKLLLIVFLQASIVITNHHAQGHRHYLRRRIYYTIPGTTQGGQQKQQQNPTFLPIPVIPMSFKFPMKPPAIVDVNNIVRFNLYTRQNAYTPQEIGLNSATPLASSNFRTTRATKILIHGFVDSAVEATAGEWMNQMREAYLAVDDVNVIIMDYSIVALFLFYWTNLPQLSAEMLARNILKFNESGAPLESFHLIGRSWGSHVAGVCGHRLQGKLGRITGLDPANPPFHTGDFQYRLDKTDAQFVDVYHLNGKNRFLILNVVGISNKYDGLAQPFGHVDIYPNYRQRQITGCPIHNATLYTESCRLGLGARLFMETIKRPSAFPVCFCESFLKYLRGECECTARNSIFMGEHMPSTTTGLYQMSDMSWVDTVMEIQGQTSTQSTPVSNSSSTAESTTTSSVSSSPETPAVPAESSSPATTTTTTTTTTESTSSSSTETIPSSSVDTVSDSSSSTSMAPEELSSSVAPSGPAVVSEDGQSVSSQFIPKGARQ